jgi:hypothetical protein
MNILEIYSRFEQDIQPVLKRARKAETLQDVVILTNRVNRLLRELDRKVYNWVYSATKAYYMESIDLTDKRINRSGLKVKAPIGQVHTDNIMRLAEERYKRMRQANYSIGQNIIKEINAHLVRVAVNG